MKSTESMHKGSQNTSGSPLAELQRDLQPPSDKWALEPIILEGEETVLLGHGPTMSYVALFLSLCAQEPGVASRFGWPSAHIKGNIMFLDWESREETIRWRWNALLNGLNIEAPEHKYYYKQCSAALQDIIDDIREDIIRLNIRCIIIDLISEAISHKESHEDCNRFFTAVHSLPCTTLLIGPTNKDRMRTALGSKQLESRPRMIWEAVAVRQDQIIKVNLNIRKSNISLRVPHIELVFVINEEAKAIYFVNCLGLHLA